MFMFMFMLMVTFMFMLMIMLRRRDSLRDSGIVGAALTAVSHGDVNNKTRTRTRPNQRGKRDKRYKRCKR